MRLCTPTPTPPARKRPAIVWEPRPARGDDAPDKDKPAGNEREPAVKEGALKEAASVSAAARESSAAASDRGPSEAVERVRADVEEVSDRKQKDRRVVRAVAAGRRKNGVRRNGDLR
jgi:hypothetical protein